MTLVPSSESSYMMIITKHKRDVNLVVLQLGAALAVTFAGFLFSRFRKNTKSTIRPTLPPLRPQPSGLCSILLLFYFINSYTFVSLIYKDGFLNLQIMDTETAPMNPYM